MAIILLSIYLNAWGSSYNPNSLNYRYAPGPGVSELFFVVVVIKVSLSFVPNFQVSPPFKLLKKYFPVSEKFTFGVY